MSSFPLGPVFGLILAAICVRLPEDLQGIVVSLQVYEMYSLSPSNNVYLETPAPNELALFT